MVTTPPSFKIKLPKETRENLLSVLAFSAHVDVIKIENQWCFPLSARRLHELSLSARVQW